MRSKSRWQKTSAAKREREKFREQILDTLERWGVRDFRTLALLPEHALASRLGEAGTRLQRLARGAGMRTLALCEPPSRFEEAMELESPVETLEPLSFILNRLLEQLCARLEARALAAQELHLRLQLERRVADEDTTTAQELSSDSHSVGQAIFERTLRLPVAMRDAKVFLKLLQLELAAHPPGAPVTKVWITAEPAPPRSAQRGLFLPISPEAERLEITLARISGVVGERRAGIARLLDSHRRDSFRMERFMAAPEEFRRRQQHPTVSDIEEQPPLALRIFRPARQLRVRLSEGRPVNLTDRGEANRSSRAARTGFCGRQDHGAHPGIGGRRTQSKIAQSNGHGLFDREEWDVALANETGRRCGAVSHLSRPRERALVRGRELRLTMYIELHARSAFSFLEGASVPEELAEVCAAHQMPAMALLDRDGVYGAPRFHLAMKKLNLKAHIGAEITSLLTCANVNEPLPRVPLLCASREGYQNLCRLITRMKLRAPKYPASLPRRAKPEEESHPAFAGSSVGGRSQRVRDRADLPHRRR